MRSRAEGIAYVQQADFMVRHQFAALDHYGTALDEIKAELERIENAKRILSDVFVSQDQWSVAANFHHGQFVQRMEKFRAREAELAGDHAVPALLARVGATMESIDLVAGAVLQIGKQALSYRFGGKADVPRVGRHVGTQDVVDVIWEGRNHAMHWEEAPHHARLAMLTALQADCGVTIVAGGNDSRAIVEALGWKAPHDVLAELRLLVG